MYVKSLSKIYLIYNLTIVSRQLQKLSYTYLQNFSNSDCNSNENKHQNRFSQNGTTPHPSALYEISPREFDKMTNEDFLLVVRAVKRVQKYLYDKEGFKGLMEWVDELTELPSRVPITTKQL